MAKNSKKQKVAEVVKDKLEDAALEIVEKANTSSHPWYKKALLYILAVVFGGSAFVVSNYGEQILSFLEDLFKALI